MAAPEPTRKNTVLIVLAASALAGLWLLDFSSIQPNRIVPGISQNLFAAAGTALSVVLSIMLAALVLLGLWSRSRRLVAAVVIATAGLCLLPWLLVSVSLNQLTDDQPSARIGLGAAFWLLLFLLSLMLVECWQRVNLDVHWRLIAMAAVIGSWSWAYSSGQLEALGLLREYHSRSGQFHQALRQHLLLVGGAVGCSLVLGFALAVQILRRPRWQEPVLNVLSFFQTIPSLALFGLLIAPLSYLSNQWPWLQQFGIRGIGWAPAVLALIGYSLLPIVRNTWVALSEVSPGVVDAARGMGMSPAQVFIQVRLPLSLPVLLEGVRITTIQAIGLTAVAALIGAGGLGTFIFQGLGQAANELILLGALPTIGLALLADGFLTAAIQWLRQRHLSTSLTAQATAP
ncbi:MAG: ABC transporter permease [Saccharospirillum sp.]|nr:ABC transporter permease [Saccharospirillum sp.]